MPIVPPSNGAEWLVTERPEPDLPPVIARVEHAGGLGAGICIDIVLEHALTLGSEPGSDFVLSGPDVLAHHARLEPTARGPCLVLAHGARADVNGRRVSGEIGLMPGDDVELGANRLILALDGMVPRREWRLLSGDQRATLLIAQPVDIGSGPHCQLRLQDPDIADHHARLIPRAGMLWIQDAAGAGTFINDEPVRGARLLAAGDRLRVGTDEFHITAMVQDEPHQSSDPDPVPYSAATADAASAVASQSDPDIGHPSSPPQRVTKHGHPARDASGSRRPSSRPSSDPRPRRGNGRVLPVAVLLAAMAGSFIAGLMLDRDAVVAQVQFAAERLEGQVPDWVGEQIGALGRTMKPDSPAQTVRSQDEAATTPSVSRPPESYEAALGTINTLRDLLRESPGDDVLLMQLSELSNLYQFLGDRAADQGDAGAAAEYHRLAELAAPTPAQPAASADSAASETPVDPAVDDLLREAVALKAAGNLSAPQGSNAIETLRLTLARDPSNAEARNLLNDSVDEQLGRATRLMAQQDYDRAAALLAELHATGIAESDAGDGIPWLDAAQQRNLHIVAVIIEADRYLQQSGTASAAGGGPGPRLRATMAASPAGELSPRVISDIGDILAVAAREARWAGRDQEARRLQDLQQRLSLHATADATAEAPS
jgi:tetratricopeptide (TPR) repeat protein